MLRRRKKRSTSIDCRSIRSCQCFLWIAEGKRTKYLIIYPVAGASGNPDNGFDIFADVPTDDDDDDVNIDEMFDDSITAAVPTYELPAESPDR